MIRQSNRSLCYSIALLLSIDGKKTCENLGRAINKSGDTMLRLLNEPIVTMRQLIKICKETFKQRFLYLILDDTSLSKVHSLFIAGTSDNYDSSNNTLGIGDCQARTVMVQRSHIMNVFLAYAILQLERKERNLTNAEKALRRIRRKSHTEIITSLIRPGQIFGAIYA